MILLEDRRISGLLINFWHRFKFAFFVAERDPFPGVSLLLTGKEECPGRSFRTVYCCCGGWGCLN